LRREHELEHGALAEGMRDDLGAPPRFAEQPLEPFDWNEQRRALGFA
jgi:hypothetical protein